MKQLGLRLEEPEEIAPDASASSARFAFETAGVLDREAGRIVIAQKFRLEYRRFTLAHELGHALLHPDVLYHRDRPLNGAERANLTGRSLSEQEADLFAAELLMPTCLVNEVFLEIYRQPVGGVMIDDDLLFWLKAGTGEHVTERILSTRGAGHLAMLIAKNGCFRGQHFLPLHQIFGVSLTAMQIQLTDLHLVF